MRGRKGPMKPPAKIAAAASAACKPLSPAGEAGRRPSPSRLRCGNDTAPAPASRPRAQDPAIQRPPEDVTVDVVVVAEARSFEALVPPGLMKQLGLIPGCSFVEIESESDKIICEVGLSTSLTKKSIGFNKLTASVLVDNSATMRKTKSTPRPLVNVSIRPIAGDIGLEGSRQAALEELCPEQLAALFRLQCQGHVVFRSMVASLRVATQEFRVEVESLKPAEDGAADLEMTYCGRLVSSSQITVLMRSAADGQASISPPLCETAAATAANTSRSLLITGDSGCGKTFRLKQECEILKRNFSITHSIELNVARFLVKNAQGGVSNATALREVFREAHAVAPSIVMIDDLQLLCPSSPPASLASPWGVAHVASALANELDECGGANVWVIASSPSVEALAPHLVAHHRLGGCVVSVSPPSSTQERLSVLRHVFLSDPVPVGESELAGALAVVAEHAHGCTQRDLARLKLLASSEAFSRCGSIDNILGEDVLLASKKLRPSALRNMEVAIPNVTWADIGGSSAAKAALQDCVDWCLGKNRWIFDQYKLTPPKGVLLYGPPGCSKTMLAKALANESKMNFISIKGPEVFSKWVGDSEKAVRDIFRKARAVAPCVVFVDELDGMCGHRGSGGVSDRVISQFLTELDGLPAAMSEKSDSIILVAATNRPENIDGAVLRPGRIDKKVYVGLPDIQEREAIAQLHIKRMPTQPAVSAAFVAQRTDQYTGAEVVAVCKEAAFHALERDFSTNEVTMEDMEAALKKVTARISPVEVEWYKKWARGLR